MKRLFTDGAASAAANKGIDYFWQIASTMRGEKTCELFRKLANGVDTVPGSQGASEHLNKLVKKTLLNSDVYLLEFSVFIFSDFALCAVLPDMSC